MIPKGQNSKGLQEGHNEVLRFDNPLVSFLYKKTEKLSVALHLVTNFVPENEPLRNRLREKGLCLLSEIILLKTNTSNRSRSNNSSVGHSAALAGEIVALLEIAGSCNYISSMNCSLLKKEYILLSNTLAEREAELYGENEVFSEDFFDVSAFVDTQRAHFKQQDLYNKRQYKGHIHGADKPVSFKNIKDNATNNTASNNTVSSKDLSQNLKSRHGERKNDILNIIRQKGTIGVKDASEVIQNCSEKTIQRELLSLVKQGVLKKEGERRWSTYSLV